MQPAMTLSRRSRTKSSRMTDDVEQAFADEVLADDEGDFADGDTGGAAGGRDAA